MESRRMSEAGQSLRRVQLFTDGACSGNPGPGGWAFLLRDLASGTEREGSGGLPETTNNQMELMAVIQGLSALKRTCDVELHADSVYVLQGMKEWMAGWKRNGWRRRNGSRWEAVKNVELWQQLDQLQQLHRQILARDRCLLQIQYHCLNQHRIQLHHQNQQRYLSQRLELHHLPQPLIQL